MLGELSLFLEDLIAFLDARIEWLEKLHLWSGADVELLQRAQTLLAAATTPEREERTVDTMKEKPYPPLSPSQQIVKESREMVRRAVEAAKRQRDAAGADTTRRRDRD